MKKYLKLLTVGVFLSLILISPSWTKAANKTIHYQGRMRDVDGALLNGITKDIKVTLNGINKCYDNVLFTYGVFELEINTSVDFGNPKFQGGSETITIAVFPNTSTCGVAAEDTFTDTLYSSPVAVTSSYVDQITGNNTNLLGDSRIGLVTDLVTSGLGGSAGYGNRLFFSGGSDWSSYNSDNSDSLWIARYNIASNQSELRINIGDDTQVEDKLVIGRTATDWDPKMVVQSDGNVGIGKTDPQTKLHLYDEIDGAALELLRLENHGINSAGPALTFYGTGSVENGRIVGRYSSLLFGTGVTGDERMRIDSIGNVGIGTTTPNNLLQVFDLISFNNTDYKTQIGYQAGKYDLGQGNTWLGYQAGSANNVTGKTAAADSNTGIGYRSLYSNNTGHNNIGVGYGSLYSNTTGYYNTGIGSSVLSSTTTGHHNTATGFGGLSSNTTGNYNSSYGSMSLYLNINGNHNTASGYRSLYSNTSGSNNTGIGDASLYSNTTGIQNTSIGKQSLYSNTSGSYNTASGYRSLYGNTTGLNNTAMGDTSLQNNTTGNSNTAVGVTSLSLNTTGLQNTAYGLAALSSNMTGNNNTGIGLQALNYNAAGSNNTALGYYAGAEATIAGVPNTSATNALYLGDYTRALAVGQTNEIIIGSHAYGLGSNSVVLGDDNITKTALKGYVGIATTTPSDTLQVNGYERLGLVLNDGVGSTAGRLIFSGGTDYATWNSDNSDPLWVERFNTASDQSVLRMNIGDVADANDKFQIGRTSGGTWTPTHTFTATGNLNILGTYSCGAADIAEAIPQNEDNLQAGDVVVISKTKSESVEKSKSAYDYSVIGIVSTNPGMVLGEDNLNEDTEEVEIDGAVVALAGRVPACVVTENGQVKMGDLLVTSSTPGCLMKGDAEKIGAGMLVGKAMENMEGNKDSIIVFVE